MMTHDSQCRGVTSYFMEAPISGQLEYGCCWENFDLEVFLYQMKIHKDTSQKYARGSVLMNSFASWIEATVPAVISYICLPVPQITYKGTYITTFLHILSTSLGCSSSPSNSIILKDRKTQNSSSRSLS